MEKEIKDIHNDSLKGRYKNHKVSIEFKGDYPNEEMYMTTLMSIIDYVDNSWIQKLKNK
tara:strand:- start:668 stop:844 length:177 start_codon:yes stop_codon:yes gene_type:complete